MRKVFICVVSGFFVIACATPEVISQTTKECEDGLTFAWRESLPLKSMSPQIDDIGGTEVRSLTTMGEKLYAGVGYWSDSRSRDPRLPGAQVLVLDSTQSKWKVDLELPDRVTEGPSRGMREYLAVSILSSVKIETDQNGTPIPPQTFLLAGVWTRSRGTVLFYKSENTDHWTKAQIALKTVPYNPIRSFYSYQDKVTHISRIFAGMGSKSSPAGVYSAVYDSGSNMLRWDSEPETWLTKPYSKPPKDPIRVTSFTEANGRLYATAYNRIFEREDGETPIWRSVYEHPMVVDSGRGTGFRGMTAIPNPTGEGRVLLLSLEDNPFLILRVDPHGAFKAVEELNVSEFLSKAWKTRVTYGISAYNDMLSYPYPSASCPSYLIGFEADTPDFTPHERFGFFNANANFLIRHCDGSYEWRQILDPKIVPKPKLVSARTLVMSPFRNDPEGTVFAGGSDANGIQVHNAAWIYKGTLK